MRIDTFVEAYDPVLRHRQGELANPNMVVVGQAGSGKSTLCKWLLKRLADTNDGQRRWFEVLDPRGEYVRLAEVAGLERIALSAAGPLRSNRRYPGAALGAADQVAVRRREVLEVLATLDVQRLAGSGRGVVVDLSEPVGRSEIDGKAAIEAAISWLDKRVVAGPAQSCWRYRVYDDGWRLTDSSHTAQFLFETWTRNEGLANILVIHWLADLRPKPPRDGPGALDALAAEAGTQVVFGQSGADADVVAQALGLSDEETGIVANLPRGMALWKMGSETAVRQHVVDTEEWAFCELQLLRTR